MTAVRGVVLLAGLQGADKGALALAVVQQPPVHQLVDGLAQGRPGDAQDPGQLPFRQQLLAGLEVGPVDQLPQLFEDLLGDALGLYLPISFHGLISLFPRRPGRKA